MNIDHYLCYDLPIPYRNIKIYPGTVRDYIEFTSYSQCLYIDKDTIPDPTIISMKDLDYIVYATEQNAEKQPYLYWFDRLLAICLKQEKSFENLQESLKRYKYDEKHRVFFVINGEKYTNKDFLKIKDIICKQNLVELPDKTISKEVRDSLDEGDV